jgi:hypothetical protein
MPRASWRGLLRLSLVSGRSICRRRRHAQNPFACTRWQPAPADVVEDDLSDRGGGQQGFCGIGTAAPSLTSPIRPAVARFSSGKSLSGKGERGPKHENRL